MFSHPGVSLFNLQADGLHVMDLGYAFHALGNVFFHICYYTGNRFGANPAARCHHLFERIVVEYRARNTPSRLNHLQLSMFADLNGPYAHHPCLSGRIKAAEARHLVQPVVDIWSDWHDATSSSRSTCCACFEP